MKFILKGFREVMGFRVFAFDGIADDRTRTSFTVRSDLALARRYGIRLQELPLLCRAVLERSRDDQAKRAFTYTEKDMCLRASDIAAREAEKPRKHPPRRPPVGAGAAWRAFPLAARPTTEPNNG